MLNHPITIHVPLLLFIFPVTRHISTQNQLETKDNIMAVIRKSPLFFITILSFFFTFSTSSMDECSATTVLKPHGHKDHHSLLVDQLDRDTARVNSIFNKIQLALARPDDSDPHPEEKDIRPEVLSTPVKSGISEGSGEYFARIGVGQPPQQFQMSVDTGSDVTWLQCRPCTRCYPQSDPIFDPSKSSTHGPLDCKAQQCRQLNKPSCNRNKCQYEFRYGDGSFTIGDLVTETVAFGKRGSVPRLTIGCAHNSGGLFKGSAGILGLGRGPLSITTQVKATSFSYCLVLRNSNRSSTLEFNSPRLGDSVMVRMLRNPKPALGSFYYAGFTGVRVGGRRVPVPASTFAIEASGRGGMIVDSGTAVTRLSNEAYVAVRDTFTELTRELGLPRAGGESLFDTCYNFSGMAAVTVPTVSFEGEGGRFWNLPPEGYLISVGEGGRYCFAMAASPAFASILGNVQQQGTRLTFDLANSFLGFSSYQC